MISPRLLVISDETEFARALMARWQAEKIVPAVTLLSSDLSQSAIAAGHELVIVGPLRRGDPGAILRALEQFTTSVICVVSDSRATALRAEHPRALIVPYQDGWANTLVLLATEALRRVDAVLRARRAEKAAANGHHQATLGRYMLEMRHNFNDALTSMLGNADLLLLEPGELPAQAHEQVKTIHAMALRLNEIMQRFSSLASEMEALEKESQVETPCWPR